MQVEREKESLIKYTENSVNLYSQKVISKVGNNHIKWKFLVNVHNSRMEI